MTEPLKARASLVARLARNIREYVFQDCRHMLDDERLEAMIDCWLPQTYAEREAELDEERKREERLGKRYLASGPSILAKLRAALGEERCKGLDMIQTLMAAVEFIEKHSEAIQ